MDRTPTCDRCGRGREDEDKDLYLNHIPFTLPSGLRTLRFVCNPCRFVFEPLLKASFI